MWTKTGSSFRIGSYKRVSYRLTKIYTRSGDDGTTHGGNTDRVHKDSARIVAYGDLDELNSLLGLLRAYALPADISAHLKTIQHLLFDLGGDLCVPGRHSLSTRHVEWLEASLDHFNQTLPPLAEFIIPGGDVTTATCHLARTVCRRAERSLVSLAHREPVPDTGLAFINRLSDYLFVAARVIGRSRDDAAEHLWQPVGSIETG